MINFLSQLFSPTNLPAVALGAFTGIATMFGWLRFGNRRGEKKSSTVALNRRLHDFLRIAQVGGWEWDPLTDEVWWSDEHYRLFGVTPETFTPSYEAYLKMIHPEDVLAVRAQTEMVLQGENDYGMEYRIIRPNGSILWVQSKGIAVRDDSGRLIRLTGIDQEITERKQAEKALIENVEKFRAIFDQTFQFIGLMSIDGVLVHANRSALEASGLDELLVIGKNFVDTPWWTHDPDQQEKLRQAIKQAANGEMIRFEASHPSPDGGLIWVDFSLKPYHDETGVVRWLIPEGRDITERKRTELELQVSRERFEHAVAGSRDGIWDWDLVTSKVYFSPRWKEMLGYTDAEIANAFEVWEGLLHPEDRPKALDSLSAYFDGRMPVFEIEFRMRAKNGEWRWILSRAIAFRDENGKAVRMSGSHTDVTDRRRAADELAANKSVMTFFIKHAPAAIAMLDRDMRYLRTSDRWLSDYRLTGQDIIGRSHYEVFPDLPVRWRAIHRRVLQGSVEACDEDPFPRADGKVDWLQWEARPWRTADGEIGGLFFFTQVITERKRVEAALRESEERYRSVVESLAEGIIVQDQQGAILTCNNRAEAILGLSRDQIAGRTSLDPRWRAIREDGDSFPGEEHPAMQVLRTGEPIFNTLMGIHKPSGELTWITVNAVPIRHSNGSNVTEAVVASFHDVTESLMMNDKLRSSLKEKDVLLQEIHHRVKNNLAITIGLFNVQVRELEDGPGKEALIRAQDRVRTMALVHEMLYQAPSFSQVDLPGYISQLVRNLSSGYAVDSRVRIELDIEPISLPLASAIPFGLILNEVVSNSFKYAFPEGREGNLRVSLKNEEMIVLEVQDDGQNVSAKKSFVESRSMGLRLVRELASQLDGHIEFNTDAGTRFRLLIPTGLSYIP